MTFPRLRFGQSLTKLASSTAACPGKLVPWAKGEPTRHSLAACELSRNVWVTSSCAAVKNSGYALLSQDSVLGLPSCYDKLRDSPSSPHPHVSSWLCFWVWNEQHLGGPAPLKNTGVYSSTCSRVQLSHPSKWVVPARHPLTLPDFSPSLPLLPS